MWNAQLSPSEQRHVIPTLDDGLQQCPRRSGLWRTNGSLQPSISCKSDSGDYFLQIFCCDEVRSLL